MCIRDRYYTTVVMTDKSKGNKGMSILVIPADAPGLSIGKHEKKMGIRGSATADLIFDNCIVPKENLIGREGDGFKMIMQTPVSYTHLDVYKRQVYENFYSDRV